MAELLGALVATGFLTAVWMMLVRGIYSAPARIITACSLSLLTVTVLAGFGKADGGSPKFEAAFALYALPQIIILALLLWRSGKMPAANRPASSPVVERAAPSEGSTLTERDLTELNSAAISSALGLREEKQWQQAQEPEDDEPFEVAPPAPTPRRPRSGNLFAQHWRGQYSLGVSYWGINVLVQFLTLGITTGLALLFSPEKGYEPLAIFSFGVLNWLVVLLLTVWQVVGLWRSANSHADNQRMLRRTSFWARAAQFLAVVAVLQTASLFVRVALPQIGETYRIAFQNDPDIPSSQLTLLEGGTEISLVGGIKYGLTSDLKTILNAAPNVKVIHLTSPGGRIAEAKKAFALIRERQLDTYVSSECSSACTLLFGAGRERKLLDGARLGFHSASFPGATAADLESSNADWSALLRGAGIDGLFLRRAFNVSPMDMWYPNNNELLQANVVTGLTNGSGFATSGQEAVPTIDEVRSQLRASSPIFDAIELVDTEGAKSIYDAVRKATVENTDLVTLQRQIRAISISIVSRHYPLADDAVLVDLANLLADTYADLLGKEPELCFVYASGIGDMEMAYGQISAALQDREKEINEAVLRSSQSRAKPSASRMDAISDEVSTKLREGLSDAQLEVLGTQPSAIQRKDYGQYCIAAIVYFRSIAGLAVPAAGDMMRELFANR